MALVCLLLSMNMSQVQCVVSVRLVASVLASVAVFAFRNSDSLKLPSKHNNKPRQDENDEKAMCTGNLTELLTATDICEANPVLSPKPVYVQRRAVEKIIRIPSSDSDIWIDK